MIILPPRIKRAGLAALGFCALLMLCACALTDAALMPTAAPSPHLAPIQTPPASNTPTPPMPAMSTPASGGAACVVVNTEGLALNVRTGPGLSWPVRYAILPGESISLANPTPGAAWYPLASGGYISADFCEVIK